MAPEQIRGEDVSAATDIYALGCMIHECLTGTPPFGGRPRMRVLFAHLQEAPPDISEARSDINAATAKAINRALEKEPEDRPASAAGYIKADRSRPPGSSPACFFTKLRRVRGGLRVEHGPGVVDAG